jgi:hypothetical protein
VHRSVLLFLCACGISARGEREVVTQATPAAEPSAPTSSRAADVDPSSDASTGDVSVDAPPASDDAFTGAPAFVAAIGPAMAHDDDSDDYAKRTCLSSECHGPDAKGPRFFAAGTVAEGGGMEVRIRTTNGAAFSAFTDPGGNFFFTEPSVAFAALTGVRNATTKRTMKASAQHGDCNGCHRPL